MITVLLIEPIPNLIQDTLVYLERRFSITDVQVQGKFIHSLHKEDGVYDLPMGVTVSDYYGLKKQVSRFVEDVTPQSLGDVIASYHIKVDITFTDDVTTARRWLKAADKQLDIVSLDFEANDLTIPQFNDLTMMTLGWSLTTSLVIVFNTDEIKQLVLDWLVTTKLKQVWHNALFDVRLIHHFTGKFPHNLEDSMLLAGVYNNHVDLLKRKKSLKELAKDVYLDWGNNKASFDLYDTSLNETVKDLKYVGTSDISKYNLALIKYCGIDQCATTFVYQNFDTEKPVPSTFTYKTSEPRDNVEQFNQRHYYEFILKAAIKPTIRMLNNGQHIDIDAVHVLKDTVEEMKERLTKKIDQVPLIRQFQSKVDQVRIDNFLAPVHKAWAYPKYTGYVNNIAMRTWVVNQYLDVPMDKVSAKDLKSLDLPICKILTDKHYLHPILVKHSIDYANYTAEQRNINMNRVDKVNHPEKYLDLGFNPFNYSQLATMWTELGLVSDELSKTSGEMSFSKDVLKKLSQTEANPVIKEVITDYLEIAQAKNIITQYIPKYIGSTVYNRVYGSIALLGTISGRLSGKAAKISDPITKHKCGINLVTQPSSASAFSKPVKRVFTAAPGKILAGVDYANLEGHIGAILTKDATSIQVLVENFDSHCLHSAMYWTKEWEELTGIPFDKTSKVVNEQYKALTVTSSEANSLRSESKGVSFGLAYGAYPPKVAKSIGCSMAVAQQIFDNYHNVLYPGVTAYKNDYVLPTVEQHGYIHLNYGLRLFSNNPKKDIRTLANATMQGYSVLTQTSLVEFDKWIEDNGLRDRIKIVNIIHDALYMEMDDDLDLITLVNNTLPAIMTREFVTNQSVQISAELDFGYNLKDVVTIPNNATKQQIKELLNK